MTLSVISTPLAGGSIARLAVEGKNTDGWFAEKPGTAAEWKARGARARESLANSDWLRTLEHAFGASGLAAERLARAAKSGFAVTTGQQPGLFGGPLYTWWKALSALALADRLEQQTGQPVVPIFWAATDDSDFAEAASTMVATGKGTTRILMPARAENGVALADTPLGDVASQLEQLAAAAGSAPHVAIVAQVRAAYAPGQTVGGAYVALLRSILEPLGIAVFDAAHESARKAALPILVAALRQSESIAAALAKRSGDLKAAGHLPQVKLVKARSLVFSDGGGKRERIPLRDAVAAAQASSPGSFGANVLLRPIVESSIIPTVAYVGGPAEIAYFAQTSAVADVLGVPAPLVVPRWSGVVIEPRVQRILDRHGLSVRDFSDPHAVESRLAKAALPQELSNRLAALRATIDEATAALAAAEGADLVSASV
ncbi:MAG: bacillithiol biosynthesis BshC, partial [Gemmatimonadaceae bacterium]|nr:bacillithiol biosynthesis BshC [Gemmatimonadaceae bacterium]